MSNDSRVPPPLGSGASYLALVNALISGLGAIAAGFGLYVAVTFIANGSTVGDFSFWWVVIAAAFVVSLANGIASARVARHPTKRGLAKILTTSVTALIVFACLKAAT